MLNYDRCTPVQVFDTMIGNLSGRDYVRLGTGEAVKL